MGDFFTKCLPQYRQDYQKCSGLTACDISPTTEDELASIYADAQGRYRIIGALLESDIMGKACQIVENPLYNFIMENAKHWGPGALNVRKKQNSGLIEVMPFIQIGRKSVINNNYWNMSGGTTGGTAPNGAAYDRRMDAASMTSIPLSVDWFPLEQTIYVSSVGAAGGATMTAWKVVDRVDTGSVIRLYLKSQNSGSRLPSYKTENPTIGVGMRGVPNISPYERYCAQVPRINTNSDYLAFTQNTRWSICNDELTRKFLEHIRDGNPLYRKYYHVEEAEYNRQVIQDFQNRLVHTFLFQKALPNQTSTDWDQLETITSWTDTGVGNAGIYLPGVEGRCVARRANAEGVYEQLQECGRVKDLFGQRMNWLELQAELYNMQRVRKDNGYPADVIEAVVDSAYRVLFIQGLVRYMAGKYEGAARFNIEVEAKKTNAGFVYQDFILDYPAGVVLRVVSHHALDDLLTAHTTVSSTLTSPGRKLLILEWNSIYMAIIESRSVERRTGTAEEIAKVNESALCVIDIPVKSVKLNTMLFTTVVECPRASLWIENFSFEVPEHQRMSGVYGDLYGDYTGNNAAFP